MAVKKIAREKEAEVLACTEMRRQLSTKKLRALMAAKGWEAAHLSAFAKVSKLTIEQLLDGESAGQTRTLLKIADALGVEDMNSLFDRLE